MTHQSSVEMLAEVDAIREEVRGEIAAASERAVAHA